MTTTTRQHDRLRMPRAEAPAREPTRAVVTVRWEISPDALTRSPAAAALLNGHAARMKSCALVWRVGGTPGTTTASAALVMETRTGETEELPLLATAFIESRRTSDDATGMETIEFGNHHELLLVLRADASLAYARTTILTDLLNLTGGVYDEPRLGK